MARELKRGIASLEPLTTAALAVLAIASGIYTYIGVRGLMAGPSWLSIGASLAYSGAVSVGIFVFWSYILKFLPQMRGTGGRLGLFGAMGIGSAAIIAMSSWLNAAALAGPAAVAQHLAYTVEQYQSRLEQAHENAIAAQSLLPDIRIAQQRFQELAEREQDEGTLTGASGRGTVEQYLGQMSSSLRRLGDEIEQSRAHTDSLFQQGGRHLNRMREHVSSSGPIDRRSIAFADEAVALTGVITALAQTSVAPAVRRQAEDLSRSFIRPAASGSSANLRGRQTEVLQEVDRTIAETSRVLMTAADDILARPKVPALRFTPLSPAEAVIEYAASFVPSWAGAIAIDLLPAVLVLILMVVQAAVRAHEDPLPVDETLTLRDMRIAFEAFRHIQPPAPQGPPGGSDEAGSPPVPAREEPAPAPRVPGRSPRAV